MTNTYGSKRRIRREYYSGAQIPTFLKYMEAAKIHSYFDKGVKKCMALIRAAYGRYFPGKTVVLIAFQ